jgi:hypothetical protein
MIRLALIGWLVLSYVGAVHAHPEHGGEEPPPAIWDKTVKDPATAWTRLQQHRDKVIQSFESKAWEKAEELAPQLSLVAGDLVRVSTGLDAAARAQLRDLVRDLGTAGHRLGEAARSKDFSRVPELLQRVNYFVDTIGAKYVKGSGAQ